MPPHPLPISMTTKAMKTVPQKLKQDAIVEALLEIRFEAPRTIPEILLGRLADHDPWKGFRQHSLPVAQIPAAIRRSDTTLRHTAWLELADPSAPRKVRIGEHVISYHHLAPYSGWANFRPELFKTIDGLFLKAPGAIVTRLGLRYINALTSASHTIARISDLDLTIAAGNEVIHGNVNLNFTTQIQPDTACTVRIATTDFIQGTLPQGSSVVIDVDVFTTPPTWRAKSADDAKTWVESAHTIEKTQFFRLLKQSTIEQLAES